MADSKVNILVALPDYLSKMGIKNIINSQPGLYLAGMVQDDEELMRYLRQNSEPSLLIIDYYSDNTFTPQTLSNIMRIYPDIKVLILSNDNNRDRVCRLIEDGVSGYLTRQCDGIEIRQAIKHATGGRHFYCNKVLEFILERSAQPDSPNCEGSVLSPREREIVELIAKGMIARDIADVLCLSTHTVYTHRKNIMKKLGIKRTSELILYAVRTGIIEQKMYSDN